MRQADEVNMAAVALYQAWQQRDFAKARRNNELRKHNCARMFANPDPECTECFRALSRIKPQPCEWCREVMALHSEYRSAACRCGAARTRFCKAVEAQLNNTMKGNDDDKR